MKKNFLILLAALSFSFAANVHAADGDSVPADASFNVSALSDCSLLSQSAQINLSAEVSAAYSCNLTSGAMQGYACHSSGGIKPTTATCSCTVDDATLPVADQTYTPLPTGCGCTDGAPTDSAIEVSGRKAYGGSTVGGSIGIIQMSAGGGTTTCTGANVLAVLP